MKEEVHSLPLDFLKTIRFLYKTNISLTLLLFLFNLRNFPLLSDLNKVIEFNSIKNSDVGKVQNNISYLILKRENKRSIQNKSDNT